MTCNDIRDIVDLYIDGELHDIERGEVEAHLAACHECAASIGRAQDLKRDLRALASEATVSDAFRDRLSTALAATPTPVAPDSTTPTRRAGWRPAAVALAASALVGAGFGLGWGLSGPAPIDVPDADGGAQAVNAVAGVTDINVPVVTQSIEWHRRQVPVEVTGPNAADVGDWFDGKVPFAVRAPDLGRPALLLGGRLGNVDETPAALLVYDVGGSKVSVLLYDAETVVLPGSARDGVYVDNSDGYTVAVGERLGVGFTFTSDLPEAELLSLVHTSLQR